MVSRRTGSAWKPFVARLCVRCEKASIAKKRPKKKEMKTPPRTPALSSRRDASAAL